MRATASAGSGSSEVLAVDEVEHPSLLRGIRHLGVESARAHQRVLTRRVQFEDAREPCHEPVVVEVPVRDARSGLVVERLQVQHQ